MILRNSLPFALLVAALFAALPAIAQESSSPADPPAEPPAERPAQGDKPAPDEPPGGKRVLGVLPNYRTADESEVGTALSVRRKFSIASKDSFDYPLVILAGALAGIGQMADQNPSFGQGLAGYGRRLGTAYADQAIGNMMTEGFFPVMLHQDPRYFRRGEGSKGSRTVYALTRIFVNYSDSGKRQFNYSEWLGNATGVAISNSYYPDGRNVGDNVTKLLSACATDAVSQVLKEFWPDVKRKFFSHKSLDH
jgi:hypothetical protein